jgi:hypothetical protein
MSLLKKITVFSDGSLLFKKFTSNNATKSVKFLDKDLKNFQKKFQEESLSTFSGSNNTNIYRKKLFK